MSQGFQHQQAVVCLHANVLVSDVLAQLQSLFEALLGLQMRCQCHAALSCYVVCNAVQRLCAILVRHHGVVLCVAMLCATVLCVVGAAMACAVCVAV